MRESKMKINLGNGWSVGSFTWYREWKHITGISFHRTFEAANYCTAPCWNVLRFKILFIRIQSDV